MEKNPQIARPYILKVTTTLTCKVTIILCYNQYKLYIYYTLQLYVSKMAGEILEQLSGVTEFKARMQLVGICELYT